MFDSLKNFNSWYQLVCHPLNFRRFNFDGVFDDKSKTQATSDIIQKLHKILGPFMLRRLKSDVMAELPKKREVVIFCPFTEVQRVFYDLVMKREILQYANRNVSNESKSTLKNILMQLRKV